MKLFLEKHPEAEIQSDRTNESRVNNLTVHNADKDAIVQIKKIMYHCNADEKRIGTVYEFSNSTHYMDSDICEWQKDSVLVDIVGRL